jgi:hypothetical protein
MVGLRVFDIGALIAWLVWFHKLRDDDGDGREDDSGGDGGPSTPDEPQGPPPGGLELPRPDAGPWPARRRDHAGDLPPARVPERRAPRPEPAREPARPVR